MAALSDEVKAFVVQALACFDTPSQVSDSVKEEFGLIVPRQQIAVYDPTKSTGRNLAKKWKDLFNATREQWRAQSVEVPIANRVFRLRVLDRLAAKAERMKNMGMVSQLLEQAAKEVGDVYVNRRQEQVAPPGAGQEGGPVSTAPEYVLKPDEDVPTKPIL